MSDTNEIVIPENIRQIADNLKSNAQVDEAVITFQDNAFKDNLPEDIKYKLAKQYEKYKIDFSAGLHLAAGELGNEILRDNDDVDTVVTMPVNTCYSSIAIAQKRRKSGVSVMKGDEKPWEHFGDMSTIYKTKINKKTGNVGTIKRHIMAEAKKMFG